MPAEFMDWMGNIYASEAAMQAAMAGVRSGAIASAEALAAAPSVIGHEVIPEYEFREIEGNGDGGNGGEGNGWGGITLPAWLIALITAYGFAWAKKTFPQFFGGQVGGAMVDTTGTDILPYDIGYINGIPLVGPGVPEPPAAFVKKRWETYSGPGGNIKCNFYALTNGKIAMYHNTYKYWRVWRPKKNIVLSSDPRISNLIKLERAHQKFMRLLAKKSKSLKLERG